MLPKRSRAYSATVLEYEMRGFERFINRRRVGSMTGLCPGIHQSDGRGIEGSINRCGIGIVLDFGGDGVAPDDLATAVSTGTSLSDWFGQRQTRQEALGHSSGTAFSD
jgi:hypothetical protein